MKLFFCLGFLALAVPVHADEKKIAPERMSATEAAQLDAAFAHKALIYQQADVAAQPFEATITAICRAHKIDPRDLGKGTGVDVATGAITRTQPPEAPKPAPSAAPAKKSSK